MKEKIRVGVIGIGGRGIGQTRLLFQMRDVELVAVCDAYLDRVESARDAAVQAGRPAPKVTTNYKEIMQDDTIDAVLCFTAWESHVPICIDAMKAGK
ncbi:MAG TPA: glycosyl hydrolase, partial [Clostridiales bacterium]|nr:glycosyl hydrolase [Clostridiales bacterium]